MFFPRGWSDAPGILALRNEYPAPVVIDLVGYTTVVHAYWALATTSSATSQQIRMADRPYDAEKLAEQAAIRTNWPVVRTAVMFQLLRAKFTQHPELAETLRAKFTQHPELAETLLATGDGRINYTRSGSGYW